MDPMDLTDRAVDQLPAAGRIRLLNEGGRLVVLDANGEKSSASALGGVATNGSEATSATAAIGSGENGVVTITAAEPGSPANDWSIAVVDPDSPENPLSAVFLDGTLTITLATDDQGELDGEANTASAVAAMIDELSEFAAAASGDGSGEIGVETVGFADGADAILPSPGVQGAMMVDDSFLYVYVSGAWKKVALDDLE